MQEATENVKPAISFPYLLPEVVSTVTAGVFRVPRAFVVALVEGQEVSACAFQAGGHVAFVGIDG